MTALHCNCGRTVHNALSCGVPIPGRTKLGRIINDRFYVRVQKGPAMRDATSLSGEGMSTREREITALVDAAFDAGFNAGVRAVTPREEGKRPGTCLYCDTLSKLHAKETD